MTEQPAWVISSATAQRRSGNVRVAAVAAMAAMDWRRSIMGFDSCGFRVGGGHFLPAAAGLLQRAGAVRVTGRPGAGGRRGRGRAEPAPEGMTSGMTPKPKAIEVITMGRKRNRAAARADSIKP